MRRESLRLSISITMGCDMRDEWGVHAPSAHMPYSVHGAQRVEKGVKTTVTVREGVE